MKIHEPLRLGVDGVLYQASLKFCQWQLDLVLQWNMVFDSIRKAHIAASITE